MHRANQAAIQQGIQPLYIYQPVRIFCCKQWVHTLCCIKSLQYPNGRFKPRHTWKCAHCRQSLNIIKTPS